jgi:hypothetical protein
MAYTLDDLLADVDAYVVTDADIDAMNERIAIAEAQFAQEARDKTPSWEWYHQICNI